MSQVKFKTEYEGEEVEVMAGWDRPLQGYFLTIFGSEDEPIYSNLDDIACSEGMGFMPDTGHFREVLTKFNIKVPEEFWARVELQEGNVNHTFDGVWHEFRR